MAEQIISVLKQHDAEYVVIAGVVHGIGYYTLPGSNTLWKESPVRLDTVDAAVIWLGY